MVEGELVLGRFTIAERIGGGGHGTVHRAWDERLCRWVAVKAVEGEAAARVMREAQAAARLNHPGIVTLYELGHRNGCAYLVSELIEGPNLRELAAAAALSDREVAEIGAELCSAVDHAHAAGVIHRDLKPDNVLVRSRRGRFSRDPGERVLLADFGIASLAEGPSLTATGQVVGTLSYMSPEQAAGEEVDAPSDVYSLALTLYELWAGYNPVAHATPAATARAIGEAVPSLAEARPELPAELCEAIDSCLHREAGERPTLAILRESLFGLRGALHPDRAVPEPHAPDALATLPPELPMRPFAILLAAGAIALAGTIAGLAGLALVATALLAPAALLLDRPREWTLPVLAPLLGVLGAAPAFLVLAARHERPAARVALAALGWAWTAIAGTLLGGALGVPLGPDSGGWAGSGPVALDVLTGSLLTPTALALALIWIGAAALLGLLLDAARAAGIVVGGLIWAAALAASVAAAGPASGNSALLAPVLTLALGWTVWDREGRPLPPAGAWGMPQLGELAAWLRRGEGPPEPLLAPRVPRNPATAPIADERIRATRYASRHVRAALHGAGSRHGLP